MEKISKNIPEKVIGNAISAYLMIFISGLFLFNKTNKNINHPFVKAHTKTAMLIHLGFLITYIIFISNSLFTSISFLGFSLNNIITLVIYIGLLGLLILGIYKSTNGDTFNISESINISKEKRILDINGDGNVSEKEKLTILLSFIPFIGFFIFPKYSNNKVLIESVRFNIVLTLLISLLYIFGYGNLANLISLLYIIGVVFIGINLFARDELISIKLPEVLSPENTYKGLLSIIYYLKSYFNNNDFKQFKTIYNLKSEQLQNIETKTENILKTKKDLKLPKFLIYIPVINLLFLFFKDTRYSFHIINGITITILLAITGVLAKFGYFNPSLHILSLFPILFGIGYINNRLAYKMPIIFDLYLLVKKIFLLLSFGSKKLKEKRGEENDVKLKVEK